MSSIPTIGKVREPRWVRALQLGGPFLTVALVYTLHLFEPESITGDLAGIPCMSVPCGKTAEGLPVGMQILTKHFDEAGMFRLADAFEKAGGFAG